MKEFILMILMFLIDTFNTTTSIPGSLGFAIHSRNKSLRENEKNYADETIFYLADYMFDGKENNDFTMNLIVLLRLGMPTKQIKFYY